VRVVAQSQRRQQGLHHFAPRRTDHVGDEEDVQEALPYLA
jgi:hypothetical protein